MPAAARLNDMTAGHGGFPPVSIIQGSPNVRINGRAAARVGDAVDSHSDGHDTHQGTISQGSSSVFINGRRAARIGDAVSCGDSIATGSHNVYIGDGYDLTSAFSTCFDANRSRIERSEDLTDTDRLILCLPDIAEAEAARAENSADRQGWTYLSQMLKRWLAGNATTAKDPDFPFYVDMQWATQYARAADALSLLQDESKLFNAAAVEQLKGLALEALGDGQSASFDYLTIAAVPGERYFQFVAVDYDYLSGVDGMTASLGNFALHAVPRGYIERNGAGRYSLTVSGVQAVIWDSIDFAGDQYLGSWNCKDMEYGSGIMGKELLNRDFREFRERHGVGSDFQVISDPVLIFSGEKTITWSE